MLDLRGAVGLVTGSGSWAGAGRAVAVRLAERGAKGVVINYSQSRDASEDVAKEVAARGAVPLLVQADVSREDQVRDMVEKTVATFGGLDILVNNAAWTSRVLFQDTEGLTEDIWDRTLAVNLKGTFFCIRSARAYLDRSDRAVVVNISSIGALRAIGSSSAAYAASKAGILNLTQTMARGLAPRIRVNAVVPGFIEGQWMRSEEFGVGSRYDATREKIVQKIPLNKIAQPEDIADAVCAMIDCRMVTGHALVVDGGYSIRD